jgi:hypothetical protein
MPIDTRVVADKAVRAMSRIPVPLRRLAVSLGTAPIIGMIAGFLLLAGGIFLSVAWMTGVQPWLDATSYAGFEQRVQGRIVDAWTTLDFDPVNLRGDKLRWFGYAKISSCAVVDYSGDSLRRAFCGNRFTFNDDQRMDDWTTLAPNVPFDFARDEKGFAVEQMRIGNDAATWLKSHAPYSTFRAADPPPKTAYEALQDQFDRPLDVAIASWSRPTPAMPLVFDPAHPEDAMPAGYVDSRRSGPWIGAMIIAAVLAAIGLGVWRAGIAVLIGDGKPVVIWAAALLPLLALPWWSDVFPRLLRHVYSDWADIATAMLDDITRVTRLVASQPDEALLVDGERLEWRLDRGRYAGTFGRIPFRAPTPLPANADAARAALEAQTGVYVDSLDASARSELFARLQTMKQHDLDNVQSLFVASAVRTLRDPDFGAAHKAAKRFLNDEEGSKYALDVLEAMENTGAARP